MSSKPKLEKMYAPKPPSSKLLRVRADELQPHPLAQRELVPARLRKIKERLDLDAIGVLHVVRYPIKGTNALWIIDGQHRWRALIDHGLGEWEVEVKLHADVTDDIRASALFLRLNDRTPVSPYDRYENELRAKEDWAVGVQDIVLTHGCKLSRQSADGCIAGIAAVKSVYSLDEGKALDKTIGTIIASWGKAASALEGKVIHGISLVYARYNGSVEEPVLVKKLSKYPGGAPGLVGDARGLMEYRKVSLARCIAERVIDTYNSARKAGRLDPL